MARRLSLVALLSVLIVGFLRPGAALAAGDRSTNLFASVDRFGNLLYGNGVSDVTFFGFGRYEVTFDTDVGDCAYIASTHGFYSQAITVFTAGGHLSSNGVYVETKNQGGGLTDGPFDLVVVCGAAGTQYAVVGYTADLVRSTPGTTLGGLFGIYEVTFPKSVERCAYVATVGDPANGLVYSPAGVYTASGPDANTVYIETKNPGGGLQPGVPFHLAAICPSANAVRVGVVAATGLLDRGSLFTSSFRYFTGHYVLVSDRRLTRCAAVATRGSVSTGVPYTPATVEITSFRGVNTIGIEVRDLLFFGGEFINQAFHISAVC